LSSEKCSWLHNQLESLPLFRFPFDIKALPPNGIYSFYEEGEIADHENGLKPRIVRIGTHKENNFQSRIAEHFLLNESKMNFTIANPKPSDRSIFRKNIGRALLNKNNDYYLKIWNIDYTSKENRLNRNLMRYIEKERQIEAEITKILHSKFSFKYIILEGQEQRIGKQGLESRLIGTVANCNICKPSENWLGRFSTIEEIRNGKLWLSQYLTAEILTEQDKEAIAHTITDTKEKISRINESVYPK
jgi:hypothetical protein